MKKVTNQGDLRVRRTRKLLWEALMGLIAEHDFESITVNNICDRAMIHRTTFYNHYEDKYDLFNSGVETMYAELTADLAPPASVIATYDPNQAPDYFVQLFHHVQDNRTFYSVMFKRDHLNPFQQRVQDYLVELSLARLEAAGQQQKPPPPIPTALIARFDAGAIISVIFWWVQHDFSPTPEIMARHVMQLIAYGTFPLFTDQRG